MNKYDFTLILAAALELTDDIADVLFEAGCDDGTPGTCNGVFSKGSFYGKKENVSFILPRCQIRLFPSTLYDRDLSHGWSSW